MINLRKLTKEPTKLEPLRPPIIIEKELLSIFLRIIRGAEILVFGSQAAKGNFTEIKNLLKTTDEAIKAQDYTSPFEMFMNILRSHLRLAVDNAQTKIAQVLYKEEKRHRRAFAKSVKAAYGLDLESILSDRQMREQIGLQVRKNVSLIKGMTDEMAKQVEFVILDAASKGESRTTLSERLRHTMLITRKRARLIARDQAATFNGILNKVRQKQVGINKYVWETMLDERVRHEHRIRHGKVFRWDQPPEDGHPGEPINCRCTAIPYITAV